MFDDVLCRQEGAFLVRDCSRNTTQEPFVLAVFYDNRVFNVQIRYCSETCRYTLGTRIKTGDVSSIMASAFEGSQHLHSTATYNCIKLNAMRTSGT